MLPLFCYGFYHTGEVDVGLFDTIKAATNQAKQTVFTASSGTAAQLWDAHKEIVYDSILSYATKAAQSGNTYISDDEKYQVYVIDPAWDLLPLPIRMIGRQRLRWDAIFQAARESLFLVDDGTVSLHPDARCRLEKLLSPQLLIGEVEKPATDATTNQMASKKRLSPETFALVLRQLSRVNDRPQWPARPAKDPSSRAPVDPRRGRRPPTRVIFLHTARDILFRWPV